MQLSFDPSHQQHAVTIVLSCTADAKSTYVLIKSTNKAGEVLASAGVKSMSAGDAELLPQLLAEVARGWLYGSANESVTLPWRAFRLARKLLATDHRWGGSSTEG